MKIKTMYDVGTRVAWFYRSTMRGEVLTGEVSEIDIEVTKAGTEITYVLECDKEIKQSTRHIHPENEVYHEIMKSTLQEYHDKILEEDV